MNFTDYCRQIKQTPKYSNESTFDQKKISKEQIDEPPGLNCYFELK